MGLKQWKRTKRSKASSWVVSSTTAIYVSATYHLIKLRVVTVSVASAGAGGQIELHQGAVDGPLLGKTAVGVNGDWLGFYEKSIELQPTDTRADLFLVFKNAEHRSGLMNIDWIEFK
ncbi:MAG: carbohydrate-binding protein [Pirellulaceae bacterium]|jgi:hypothetical protein|nr:carbohydrate-binding protein [Pirellulaceae bacterium]